MKRKLILWCVAFLFAGMPALLAQGLQPFYKVGEFDKGVAQVGQEVEQQLKAGGYDVIGTYNPGNNDKLLVICFTSNELKELSLQFPDRGALASVLKAAVMSQNGKSVLSFLNPEYMFLAYWGKQLNGQENQLSSLSENVKNIFAKMGTLEPFGGSVNKDNLPGYHYKVFMPYFTDPDNLETYASFDEGLTIIRNNLAAHKMNTQQVFEQVFPDKKIAVFGVGLMDSSTGESHFLPIIGESHIAAMPYEIILQGNKATALPGKYRLALYWPELTMGTFMKIMKTPGQIKDALEAVAQK
ncbi:MAG: hypothetical protein IH595_01110 [Bacteroidales bacterium]|nr:hypothetical protein [Bacteroidales bacterium]